LAARPPGTANGEEPARTNAGSRPPGTANGEEPARKVVAAEASPEGAGLPGPTPTEAAEDTVGQSSEIKAKNPAVSRESQTEARSALREESREEGGSERPLAETPSHAASDDDEANDEQLAPGGDERIAGKKVVLGLFAALTIFATFGIAARKVVRGTNDSPEGLGVVGAVSGGWDAPTKKDSGAPVLTVPPTVGVSATPVPSASGVPSVVHDASSASAAADAGAPKPKLSKDAIGRAIDAGKYDDAIAAAQDLVDATPSDAEAWLLLGAAYDGKRDKASARAAYKSCTERAKGTFANECARMLR